MKAALHEIEKQGLTRFYLEVEEGNLEAEKLYLALGFQRLNKIKNFYGQGRHAWAMNRES